MRSPLPIMDMAQLLVGDVLDEAICSACDPREIRGAEKYELTMVGAWLESMHCKQDKSVLRPWDAGVYY